MAMAILGCPGWPIGIARPVSGSGSEPGLAFYSPLTSSLDATFGGGSLTGTAAGSAAISGGYLQMHLPGINYLTYAGAGNADGAIQTGAIRFTLKPNYSGSPTGANMALFSIAKAHGDAKNLIYIHHNTSGTLVVQCLDSAGSFIINVGLGAWSPTSGTDYLFEYNWDYTAGAHRLFIDGVQLGSTIGTTGTRSADIGLIRLGSLYDGTVNANYKMKEVRIYNTVQHTANYTP